MPVPACTPTCIAVCVAAGAGLCDAGAAGGRGGQATGCGFAGRRCPATHLPQPDGTAEGACADGGATHRAIARVKGTLLHTRTPTLTPTRLPPSSHLHFPAVGAAQDDAGPACDWPRVGGPRAGLRRCYQRQCRAQHRLCLGRRHPRRVQGEAAAATTSERQDCCHRDCDARTSPQDALEAGSKAYSDAMEVGAPRASLPVDEAALALLHERSRLAALEVFDAKAVGPAADRYRRELKTRIEGEHASIVAANATTSGECGHTRSWRCGASVRAPHPLSISPLLTHVRPQRRPAPASSRGCGTRGLSHAFY